MAMVKATGLFRKPPIADLGRHLKMLRYDLSLQTKQTVAALIKIELCSYYYAQIVAFGDRNVRAFSPPKDADYLKKATSI